DKCGNVATGSFTVTVLPGPNCNTNCISLYTSNIVAYTCSNCTTVPFNAYAVDPCCPTGPILFYDTPVNTCFPVNSTTTVKVTAFDECGHTNNGSFTVTVLPDPACPTNCISIRATNIVAYTCSNCVVVPYTAIVTDPCCTAGFTVLYNP